MTDETKKPNKDGWTLWREIYGTVIGALAVVVPAALILASYLTDHDRKIVNHEVRVQILERTDSEQEARTLQKAKEIDRRLERIEEKLDRLVERR